MANTQESLADGTDVESANESDDQDPTVPEVELSMYQLNVTVSGQTTDSLDTAEESAKRLMEYLVERAERLEDHPDGRGMG